MMSGIRGKNTKPEMFVRRGLHSLGFRFRVHEKNLPGKPDLVMKKYKAVIFVNGCFWHGHKCHLFKMPKTRTEFWKGKIDSNRKNDARVRKHLVEAGWRVLDIWECAIRGKSRLDPAAVLEVTKNWLEGSKGTLEITGKD